MLKMVCKKCLKELEKFNEEELKQFDFFKCNRCSLLRILVKLNLETNTKLAIYAEIKKRNIEMKRKTELTNQKRKRKLPNRRQSKLIWKQ